MTKDEFKPIFEELCEAYGERLKYQLSTMAVWYKVLRQWPADIVETAALEYMSGPSPYPPTPGQINSTAKQYAGTTSAQAVNESTNDQLVADLFKLYGDYWQTGEYNLSSWTRLISSFEHTDRSSMAEYARYKHEIVMIDQAKA